VRADSNEDRPDVIPNGRLDDPELGRDDLGRDTLGEKLEHLLLSCCERS
jgi:hypothetical protein